MISGLCSIAADAGAEPRKLQAGAWETKLCCSRPRERSRQATELDPSRVDSYAVLSRIYADRAEWTELEAVLQQSSQQVPDDLAPPFQNRRATPGPGL